MSLVTFMRYFLPYSQSFCVRGIGRSPLLELEQMRQVQEAKA